MTDMNNGSDAISGLLSAILHKVTRIADATEAPDHNSYCENGCSVNPDDLPSEPVEPGDLRAGDRVGYTWEGERYACTLVSNQSGSALRSDTPDRTGYSPNVAVWGEWGLGVYDVRLIERDLSGEPVEPGDLRVGDRVAFAWGVAGERIVCTLVSGHGSILRSDAPDQTGYTPNVVYRSEWDSGISDVLLIERAPREGADREHWLISTPEEREHAASERTAAPDVDEARNGDLSDDEPMGVYRRRDVEALRERAEKAEAERDDYEGDFRLQRDLAGDAEAERDEWREVAKSFEDGRDKWQARWREVDEARERAEAERDEWKARYKALSTALGVQE